MKRYIIDLSEQAASDIDNFVDYIIFAYKAPITAKRHYDGLFKTIKSLQWLREIYRCTIILIFNNLGSMYNELITKKMTIIYTVHYDIVYIHRVIAQSLLTAL